MTSEKINEMSTKILNSVLAYDFVGEMRKVLKTNVSVTTFRMNVK